MKLAGRTELVVLESLVQPWSGANTESMCRAGRYWLSFAAMRLFDSKKKEKIGQGTKSSAEEAGPKDVRPPFLGS